MLMVPVNVVDLHLKALQEYQLVGPRVFDAQLVAVMRGNGITDISTFNAGDFKCYPDIHVHVPVA